MMQETSFYVRKNQDTEDFTIESKMPEYFELKYNIKTGERVLTAASEVMRSLPLIKKKGFSFQLRTKTTKDIPIIELIPDIEKNSSRLPLIFFIHGFDTSKEKVLRYGVHFAAAGFYTVLMDLPDHGERMAPDFEEKYSFSKNFIVSWFNRMKLIQKTLLELRELIASYKNSKEADPERIGISGISIGGTIALLTANQQEQIKAAAPLLAIIDFESMAGKEAISNLSPDELSMIRSLDPLFALQNEPKAAMLLQYGQADSITNSSDLKAFDAKMKEVFSSNPGRFKWISQPGVAHDVTLPMVQEVLDWFLKFV